MITSVSANSLDVTFVDFGNSATLSTANVRPILTNFMKLPAQVFVCSLADIKPKEKSWTPKAIEQFQNLALDQHLAAYVKEKCKIIILHILCKKLDKILIHRFKKDWNLFY